MYVISGVSGNTGSAAADALLRGGHEVRALVRDISRAAKWAERGVELVQGDLRDIVRLTDAFQGASGAYVLVPPDPQNADPLGYYEMAAAAVRSAALAASLPRLVFLSSEGAHLDAGTGPIVGAHRAEAILADATPETSFLRPSFFQENWRPVFALAADQGILPSMLQPLDAPRTQVATRDIGEAAADLLAGAAPPRVVELAGPEPRSANDVATEMTRVLSREVSALAIPRAGWEETLAGAGLGPAYAALLCEMYEGINSGHVGFSGEGEAQTGRTTVAETIASWRN